MNLQAASLMINMDIPWNPAVLEQRIGRIHRYGQTQPVNIINLISAGTIEERMLGLLKFKSSVAKGILDDGDDQIFMGESKFKQFMKSVETMTQTIEPESISHAGASLTEEEEQAIEHESTTAPETATKNTDTESVSALLEHGARFLTALSETLKDQHSTENFIASIIQKDAPTGKTYLKIPVESEKIVHDAIGMFAAFMNGFQKK